MLDTRAFLLALNGHGAEFYSGIPDSLLKHLCAAITDNVASDKHIIAANEGNAIALASGYHLATGRIGVVYMQNSGLGNAINPLLSLADTEVYAIPMLLFIGWRGKPGKHDEPQHIKQGKVTTALLDAMELPYVVLAKEMPEALEQVTTAYRHMKEYETPYAFVVEPDTFEAYVPVAKHVVSGNMGREEAIRTIVEQLPDETAVVSTTGMASRELYELREARQEGHGKDFLTVGSMGHSSQIALSIALEQPERPVVCLDGDGAVLMHMGALGVIGARKPKNFIHIVLNNGAHDSVGGQATIGREVDLATIARAAGYTKTVSIHTIEELQSCLKASIGVGPVFIEVLVTKGARKDLGRPKTTPLENKKAFMGFLDVSH